MFVISDKVSIHASVKDATENKTHRQSKAHVSIHASVKDATLRAEAVLKRSQFQSTRP